MADIHIEQKKEGRSLGNIKIDVSVILNVILVNLSHKTDYVLFYSVLLADRKTFFWGGMKCLLIHQDLQMFGLKLN